MPFKVTLEDLVSQAQELAESGALEWDLSGFELLDSDIKALLHELEQRNWQPSTPTFHLGLTFNRLTKAIVPQILAFLAAKQNLTVNLGFNHFSAQDLHYTLEQAGHIEWLGKRVFHELGEVDRRLSNTALLLSQQAVLMGGWTKHHDTGTEQEVTAAVVKHLGDSAVPLEITQIVNSDGSILCEWDGVVQGMLADKEVLVFIEAKHCIKAEHLEKETKKAKQAIPLFAKLKIMQDWLTGLREPDKIGEPRRQRQLEKQYDEYRRCKDFPIKGTIGGPLFDDSLQRRARKMQFMCVVCSGNRYAVL